ncbi:MAG: DnaA regulatory inactivator Hda [Methylococcaceae bacterium]|nr:DnaA regulatory inactivator Hda [Methylococcaceae bacterium]
MSKQLPLQFEFQSNQNFSTFYPGSNEEVINHLRHIFINNEQQIFLWGDAGTGKTHLLQAVSQESNKQNKTSFYFSFDDNHLPDPEMLNGLENFDIVCFDNIDRIAENSEWEHAFFNFFNLHRDANKKLILSAHCPPKFLSVQLPDLKTRMNWGLTLQLATLSDEQQLSALIYKANDLGFEVPLNVGRFLMSHYTSDMPSIWILLDKINHATLAAKRKLTIPFLKQIMNEQEKP